MASHLVGQRPVTTFVTPVAGTAPIDANVVRSQDNTNGSTYTGHDADATIHLQDSLNASRPAAGTAGRKWLDSDTYRVYFDDGAAWNELAYLVTGGAGSVTSLTYTLSVKSTTAFATPSALAATQASLFASTVSGASLMGYGTTNDVALMNRAGTVCLGVGPNTTVVNIPASLRVGAGTGTLLTGDVQVRRSATTGVVYFGDVAGAGDHYLIWNGTTFKLGDGPDPLQVAALTATTVGASGTILSSGATSGVGYATGAGGTVTQATNKTTDVTLNKMCGAITMNAANLNNGAVAAFTLFNSNIAVGDMVCVTLGTGGSAAAYNIWTEYLQAGRVALEVKNVSGGNLAEAVVIYFMVLKGVTA